MIGRIRADKTFAARVESRDPECQVNRFAARAREYQSIEGVIEFAQQALRIIEDVLMQVARVYVQQSCLPV